LYGQKIKFLPRLPSHRILKGRLLTSIFHLWYVAAGEQGRAGESQNTPASLEGLALSKVKEWEEETATGNHNNQPPRIRQNSAVRKAATSSNG
jgi:hypothetical protein